MKAIRVIFWVLVAVFVLSVAAMSVPAINLPFRFVGISALVIIFALGVTLTVMTARTVMPRKLFRFLLTTGASAMGLPVFALLHNIVGGLLGIEEAVFFTLATIVSPLGFLVGVIGSIVLIIKGRQDIKNLSEGGKP